MMRRIEAVSPGHPKRPDNTPVLEQAMQRVLLKLKPLPTRQP
jgi:hypothetical protein